jgi:hypothetical protein
MTTIYTIIVAANQIVRLKDAPELWSIMHKKEFDHPKLMRQFLVGNISLFNGFRPSDSIKVELHEGGINTFDAGKKPMMIRSHVMPGKTSKTSHTLCVVYPNGNVQELTTFLGRWQYALVATTHRVIETPSPSANP